MDWFLTTKDQYLSISDDHTNEWTFMAGKKHVVPEESETFSRFESRIVYVPLKPLNLDVDKLVLIKVNRSFEQGPNVQPAKLPPSKGYHGHCKKVTVVGWGSTKASYEESGGFPKLAQARATMIACPETKYPDTLDRMNITFNFFCLEFEQDSPGSADSGLGIFCKGVLIGLLQEQITDIGKQIYRDSKIAYANKISHYMTWLNKVTGVNVPFQSSPQYNPTARLTVVTRMTYPKGGTATDQTPAFCLLISLSSVVIVMHILGGL